MQGLQRKGQRQQGRAALHRTAAAPHAACGARGECAGALLIMRCTKSYMRAFKRIASTCLGHNYHHAPLITHLALACAQGSGTWSGSCSCSPSLTMRLRASRAVMRMRLPDLTCARVVTPGLYLGYCWGFAAAPLAT